MPETTYSIGPAAQKLSVSQYHLRRLIDAGLVDASQTPGRQWRIPAEEIERLQEEGIPPIPAPAPAAAAARSNAANPGPAAPLAAASSSSSHVEEADDVRQARDLVTITERKLQRRRLELEGAELEDKFRERERAKVAEQEEAARHQAHARIANARRQWEESKVEWALSCLPRDCPPDIQLNVQERVRAALKDFTPESGGVLVGQAMKAATETALEPYYEAKRMASAINEGIGLMPSAARYHDSPEIAEAKSAARTAVVKLAGSGDEAAMRAAARAAVAPIARKFEHEVRVRQLLDSEKYWGFASATEAERRAALKDLAATLQALPVGISKEDMQDAKREALERHEKALRRRQREEQHAAEARSVAERGIRHLTHYLCINWDFDSVSEANQTKHELEAELRPHLQHLAESGEISATDVEDYVEDWAAEQLFDEDPEEED